MSQGPQKLKQLAGEDEYNAGTLLYQRGGVRPISSGLESLRFLVAGTPRREVVLKADAPAQCSCETQERLGACRHVVAATLMARESGAWKDIERRKAALGGPLLLKAMEGALPEAGSVRMEITLLLERDSLAQPALRLGIRVGEDRLYVVRNLPQFLDAIDNQTSLSFGKGFVFHPEWMHFTPRENGILDVLRALCQAQKEVGVTQHGMEARTMRLPPRFALVLLNLLKHLPFRLALNGVAHHVAQVQEKEIPLAYQVAGGARGILITAQLPAEWMPLTPDCAYVWLSGEVVALNKMQQSVAAVLFRQEDDGNANFEFFGKDAPRVISELVPWLQLTGVVELDSALQKQIVRTPLHAKVYLDRVGQEVVARTVFAYGPHEIDPFAAPNQEAVDNEPRLLMRDASAERAVLDELANSGFHVRKGRVYLSGQDSIFQFVSEGVRRLMNLCEIFASQDFKRMTPRKPRFQGNMRVNGGQLLLEFTEDGQPSQEILAIFQALHLRRKYFRLKDGSFLDLGAMEEWQETADLLAESAQAENIDMASGNMLSLAACRTVYLSALLAEKTLPIHAEDSVRDTVAALTAPETRAFLPCPPPIGKQLRPYQERGFYWLQSLYSLRMGGVLADDMGLGKTIQVIALIWWAAKQETNNLPTIVVTPTSLCYNWQAEFRRFAPSLSVLLLSGSQATRAEQIEEIKASGKVDVVITSYPLIRRDISLLCDIPFRFAILDEAQHIKNAASVGAVAVKQLQAKTRLALTGTPMENNTGELWSIFDFVLPGYLLNYARFIRQHGDGRNSETLRQKIRPFLLRRLKKEVLTELPDKLETTLIAEMTLEQSRVYQAALLRLRGRVDDLLRTKGINRGRTEVLAAITELRQICCHPALCLPDYSGTSGKLDLLLDILPGALETGRRILLFSQFTSMLKILRRHLEAEGIQCLYLDGETPPAMRLTLADGFNAGEGQVFLISLKAGGTGLNLTGADMVIHYDPWWNPAAEDQATDRAHRIGQTRKVEVVRLITHLSIEEQVARLGKKKRALFDQLITAGEEMPTQLSEADIRALFA